MVSSSKHKITKTTLFNHRIRFRLRSAQHKLMACIASISAAENYPLVFHITQPGSLCIFHVVQEDTEAHRRAHAFWSMSVSGHLFFLFPRGAFMIRYDRASLFTFWPQSPYVLGLPILLSYHPRPFLLDSEMEISRQNFDFKHHSWNQCLSAGQERSLKLWE